jgi:signal transduction histidine kinase
MPSHDDSSWKSIEVEAGAADAVARWLGAVDPTPIEEARARRAIRALLVENARLRAVLGHCPKGIAVLDESGTLTGFNREFGELLGVVPPLGEPLDRFFAETDRALLEGVVRRAGTTRRAAAVLRTDGDARAGDVEFLVATLPSESDRSIGIILAGDDRTDGADDARARETIESSNERLSAEIGAATIARQADGLREQASKALEIASAHGDLAPTLRDAIVAAEAALAKQAELFAPRPIEGDAEPQGRAHVGTVARRAARIACSGAPRGVSIDVHAGGSAHAAIADRDLLHVLVNLLRNAVHATEHRGGLGFVTVGAEELDGEKILISVRDDGIGIEPSRLRRCFEAFETTRDDAAGLGLAVARRLIEAAGGSIKALSEPDRGTTIVVELPRA